MRLKATFVMMCSMSAPLCRADNGKQLYEALPTISTAQVSDYVAKIDTLDYVQANENETCLHKLLRAPWHDDTVAIAQILIKKYADQINFITKLLQGKNWQNPLDIRDDARGYTALHYAALNPGGKPVIQALLTASANPNVRDNTYPSGSTPLFLAASAGNVDNVRALFFKGAGAQTSLALQGGMYGDTPLMAAIRNQRKDIARFLITKNCSALGTSGESALHVAVFMGDPELVQAILAQDGGKALVNRQDVEIGNTPLHAAVDGFFADCLHEKKCDFTHDATTHRMQIIDMLFAAGAQSNLPNKEGKTALAAFQEIRGGLDAIKPPLTNDAKQKIKAICDELEKKFAQHQPFTQTAARAVFDHMSALGLLRLRLLALVRAASAVHP